MSAGYPFGPISKNSPGGSGPYGSVDHGGETPLIPGQHGVQAWDLPGIGRIAILICFDVNFAELWHQVRNPMKLSTVYPDKAITAQPPCNRRNI